METRISLKYFITDCRSNKDREAYKKHWNLCFRLLYQDKKDYLGALGIKYVTDNEMFWKWNVLGLSLFHIYICNLFFFYADDTTSSSNGKNVVANLEI